MNMLICKINNVRRSGTIVQLEIRLDEEWEPGDLLQVIESSGKRFRTYSIAGGLPGFVRILVRDAGYVGAWLCMLSPGDVVAATIDHNTFRPIGGNTTWISTGTGAAPFIAAWEAGQRPVEWVCFGRADLFLSNLLPDTPDHTHIIRRLHSSLLLRYAPVGIVDRWGYFICGSTEKTKRIVAHLMETGVPPTNIHIDTYGAADD